MLNGHDYRMTNKLAATLLAAMALAVAPVAITPTASADICGDVGGRHVSVGGCTPGIAGDVADAAIAGAVIDDGRYAAYPGYAMAAVPSFPGEMPCYTPSGLPYYTPGDAPCYPL
jgi:hypothetical protein